MSSRNLNNLDLRRGLLSDLWQDISAMVSSKDATWVGENGAGIPASEWIPEVTGSRRGRSRESSCEMSTGGTLQRHNTENSKHIFPEKELRGLSPNFYISTAKDSLILRDIEQILKVGLMF